MTASFRLSGDIQTKAATGTAVSADFQVEAALDERLSLKRKLVQEIDLDGDGVVAVDFGGLDDAAVIVAKAVGGGPVTMRVTTDLDADPQIVSVDSLAIVISRAKPATAIDLQRSPAVNTTVKLFLGELAD